jgi:hypothetical protein
MNQLPPFLYRMDKHVVCIKADLPFGKANVLSGEQIQG